MSSGLPPSVTTSSRIFIFIGVTEVIGSTPVDVDRLQLLDPGQDGVELALAVLDLVIRHGDAGEMRDAADGFGVDGHLGPRAPRIAEARSPPQRSRRLAFVALAGMHLHRHMR